MDEKKIKHKIHVIVTMFWDRSMIFYFLISVLPSNTKYKAYTTVHLNYNNMLLQEGNLNPCMGKVYFLSSENAYMYVHHSVFVLN